MLKSRANSYTTMQFVLKRILFAIPHLLQFNLFIKHFPLHAHHRNFIDQKLGHTIQRRFCCVQCGFVTLYSRPFICAHVFISHPLEYCFCASDSTRSNRLRFKMSMQPKILRHKAVGIKVYRTSTNYIFQPPYRA